jgi:hypothetical protein
MGIVGLERPKYLSDQVWNKAVLHEIHGMEWKRPDAAGPLISYSNFALNADDLSIKPYEDIVGAEAGEKWEANKGLTYYESTNAWSGKGAPVALKIVDFAELDAKKYVQNIGKIRWDTKFLRNILFLTEGQRTERWVTWGAFKGKPSPLSYEREVGNMSNTEYFNNEIYSAEDYQAAAKLME